MGDPNQLLLITWGKKKKSPVNILLLSACKVAATAGREHGGCLGAVMVVVSVVLMVVFAPETLLRDREKVSREIIMELASERHGTVAGDPNGMVSQTVVGEVNTYDKIYSVTDFGFFAAAEERSLSIA